MEYTREQLKAAYALNLCTVSISQIIDYNDINIMEQEYEAILNNLNLEEIPKDESLLKILKQILDTITYFRIEDGDKKFIEKEYQHNMKNAIWAAVPNIGMIVAGGNPLTMAVSLASQVGIGYMNYRKQKAENELEHEKQLWELEKTAIEQFNGLRRELFDTAWRLSDVYKFPDELRLTERQIKQYNEILMDTDLLRKYARMDAIKDKFMAYPPFWYYFGNVANSISRSEYHISNNTRIEYKEKAKEYFLHFRETSGYGLLREDETSASCALELVDLLDIDKDKELISDLLKEAVAKSGRANDVMQLAAITYLKLNDRRASAELLNQLVNEQYNTILNAQLLSSVYVYEYIESGDSKIKSYYEILNQQVGEQYLYPLPDKTQVNISILENKFVDMQKEVLLKNYLAVISCFMKKYMVKFGQIIPVSDETREYPESYFYIDSSAKKERKYQLSKVFSNRKRAQEYIYLLEEGEIDFAIVDVLNDMFEVLCELDFMNDTIQDKLAGYIEYAIIENKDAINEIIDHMKNGQFTIFDAEKLLDLDFNVFTGVFYKNLINEVKLYIGSRSEMQDFAIAEDNLVEFCNKEHLPSPSEILKQYECNVNETEKIIERRFSHNLLVGKEEPKITEVEKTEDILSIIQSKIDRLGGSAYTEIYCKGNPKIERYFRDNSRLRRDDKLMANTVAIVDDKRSKGDYDLIFTKNGIVSVKNGFVKGVRSYADVVMLEDTTLIIDGKYDNPTLNKIALYEMIQELIPYEVKNDDQSLVAKTMDMFKTFKK